MNPQRPLAAIVFMACAISVWHWGHSSGEGCAMVFPQGTFAEITEERAIIVWDAASKTQHFIRGAAFQTQAPDFGFLVPTPTKPTLAEVTDDVFRWLNDLVKPRIVVKSGGVELTLFCLGASASKTFSEVADSIGSVRVLSEQRVGGFDAVVVEADDPKALNDWLNRNGYVANPELSPWLEPYVKNNWKITAFKIAHDPKTGRAVQTSSVRMSFATDKPFFPYREPQPAKAQEAKSAPTANRLLRVFFLSDRRMAARMGEAPWPALVYWADRLEDGQRQKLAQELGLKETEALPANAWLTTFNDRASPRPGNADVVFEPAAVQESVRPPDIIQRSPPIVIPLELIIVAGILAVFLLIRFLKTRAKPA
jgi:Uncharacterized protein conserved in bacteria (DUF2330)